MYRLLILLLIALAIAGTSVADELYVKNHHVRQQHLVDGKKFVELAPFVEALELALSRRDHGWLVGDASEEMPLLRPGQVWLSGKVLESRFVNGAVSISLDEAVEALGGKLKSNPVIGTTDLYLPRD